MGEKQTIVAKKLVYDGLFNYREMFRIMEFWLRDKFYDKFEKRNEEYVTPEGKQLDIEFVPWKKFTDYYKGVIKIEIMGHELKEVMVEQQGKKVKMHRGKIEIKLTGYLIVDYFGKWNNPIHYFIRDLFDRFIYLPITKKYENMVRDHVDDLYAHIAAFLNMTETQYKRQI
jgi:hypothetical protein